jgi:hypothetical protein
MSEHARYPHRRRTLPCFTLRENLAAHDRCCLAASRSPVVDTVPRLGWVRLDSELVRHQRADCPPGLSPFASACGAVEGRLELDRTSTLNCYRQAISDPSFSHNGEYLAIAGAGNVCASIFLPFL